jgi:RNA polymerase sigma factor (sigma-70 family)
MLILSFPKVTPQSSSSRASLTTLVDARASESSAFESEIADHDEMERGFRRLSPEHRAVLVLHYYIGLTIGEVAESLHIAPGTVGSRLHYAMRSLRASLESEARITGAMERSR